MADDGFFPDDAPTSADFQFPEQWADDALAGGLGRLLAEQTRKQLRARIAGVVADAINGRLRVLASHFMDIHEAELRAGHYERSVVMKDVFLKLRNSMEG